MKRSLFLIFIILFLGSCSGENKEGVKELEAKEVVSEDKKTIPTTNHAANFRDLEYKTSSDKVYESPKYTLNHPQYKPEHIEQIMNMDKFEGFTNEQKEMLIQNGFVVLPPNTKNLHRKMYTLYDENSYAKVPNFITSDTALNMFHIFFENTLMKLEQETLANELKMLSSSMRDKVEHAVNEEEDPLIKEKLNKVLAYFTIGESLISEDEVEVPDEIKDVVEKELALINAQSTYEKSPLFGYDVNYEQFIPRSHYHGDETLERYFKTMMWYGLVGFPFIKDDIIQYDNIGIALTITYFTYLDADNEDLKSWDKIYEATNLFVGESDDLSILDMKDFLIKIYGENSDYHHYFNEEFYEDIDREIVNLRRPAIQSNLISKDTPSDIQFRFMGQRYTVDSDIIQSLIGPTRTVPTALDVANVLGNDRAMEYVKKNSLSDMKPKEYEETALDMRKKMESVPEEIWHKNLYNAILWSIDSVWEENIMKGYPYFMQQSPWGDKMLQTGLGAYTELKHDTLLYVKQPSAEKGDDGWEMPKYPSYVEPQVELYARLNYLTEYAIEVLSARGLIDYEKYKNDGDFFSPVEHSLANMNAIYKLLLDVSIKELEGKELTEREYYQLDGIGAYFEGVEHIIMQESMNYSLASSLVADISSVANTGEFLEIGTGIPEEIFVILVNKDGEMYLSRGTTYSFYEFLNEKPLNDDEWLKMLGFEYEEMKIDENYSTKHYEIEPENVNREAPRQYDWIYNFKSKEENNVEVKFPEF